MSQWRQKNPNREWVDAELEKHTIEPPADNNALVGSTQGQVYGQITKRDVDAWARESLVMAAAGSTVFHDASQLGSTIAVSCDMCHPNAANTHPETYPKFQMQLGRVALLRDMINWCIEHPVRGTPLAPDDPKMRGLEAYIYAQRRGTPLDYGKR
jgi:cytochrome c